MDSIVVSVADLLKMVKTISSDGMKYVQLSISDADIGDETPSFISFSAIKSEDSFEVIDYDEIEAIENVEF